MFVPVWTSRQVSTADCYIIVTARRRLLRNCFLLSSVCMSDLAWRRIEQAHRPFRCVGHKRIDQSEASGTSASTNQKRPQGKAQAYEPSHSFTKQIRRRSTNQIRLAESIGGRLVTPEGIVGSANQIHRSEYFGRTIFGWTFFRLTSFLRTLHQVGIGGSANQIHRSEYFGRTIFGRTLFGLTSFGQKPQYRTGT